MFFRPTKHRYGHLERAMMRPANIQPIAGCESAHSMQRPVAFRPGAPASCSRYGRSPDMPPSAASSSRVALGAGRWMFRRLNHHHSCPTLAVFRRGDRRRICRWPFRNYLATSLVIFDQSISVLPTTLWRRVLSRVWTAATSDF